MKCDHCDDVFFFETTYNYHLNRVHGINVYKYQCNKCGRGFSGDHNCRNDQVKCDICDETFNQRSSLTRHKKTVHGTETVFCNICQKKCSSKMQLDKHIKSCHSNNVTCDICHKTIRNENDLKRHKALVHNEHAFFCTICPKKRLFITKETYTKHMEDAHSVSPN